VFELLEMNEQMMGALKNNDTDGFSQAAQQSKGYRVLSHTALTYAKMGVTTVEEVLKLVEMVAERDVDYGLDETSHLENLAPVEEREESNIVSPASSTNPASGFSTGGLSLEDEP
jgi:MSHA biogenesis protein MshE